MKKISSVLFILLILGCYSPTIHAQFAIVKDSIRGETPALERLKGNTNPRINILNNSVVYMYPRNADIEPWRYVDYFKSGGNSERVYIHSNFLVNVDNFEIIESERLSSHGSISFKNDSIRVAISLSNISPNDKSLKIGQGGKFFINGRQTYGANNTLPRFGYQSIVVTLKGKRYILPKEQINFLFAPSLVDTTVYYDHDSGIVYIMANNGEADNTYHVLWTIDKKGQSNVFVKSWNIL